MSKFEVGQRVTVTSEANNYWAGDGVVKELVPKRSGKDYIVIVTMTTGNAAGEKGGFDPDELIPVSGMRVLSLKRSTHKTGLKVYGKVLGESGKEYNVAYFRRPTFRGWICSCENFFFTMFAKKRNCKHLRFVRKEVGRFAASVK